MALVRHVLQIELLQAEHIGFVGTVESLKYPSGHVLLHVLVFWFKYLGKVHFVQKVDVF